MRLLVVLSLVALAVSAPPQSGNYQRPTNDAQLLRYDNNNIGTGYYNYAFEQDDGTKQEQQGELRNEGLENEYVAVKGSYSWVGPDGVTYLVTYIADENGYQPEIEEGPGGAVPDSVIASLLG